MTVIEVFADVACPFTHVGLRRFVERRAELGRDDVTLRVRAWPLELVNDHPLDPHFIAEEVDDIRRQIAPALFQRFSEASFPVSSLPALTLAAAAYEVDLATGERVSLALRDLLFEQGIDIADTDVLARLATEHDVPVDPADTPARPRRPRRRRLPWRHRLTALLHPHGRVLLPLSRRTPRRRWTPPHHRRHRRLRPVRRRRASTDRDGRW